MSIKAWFLGLLFLFFYSNMAVAEEEYYEDGSELVDTFDDLDSDPTYPGDGRDRFRCELVIVIVNLNNRFERKRHSIFSGGRSWSDSRGRVFQEYGRWIGQNRFFGTQFQHSFYFNNCF